MSKKYIKLLGSVFHDGIEYKADTVLTISETITESEADRLIRLGAAEIYTPIVIPETCFTPKKTNDSDIPPVTGMTKAQCQAELTAAGIGFKKNANLAELQKLVNDHRESLKQVGDNGNDGDDDDDDENLDINSLTREQLELELTARAIEFSSEQSDDELRQLLIDDESNDDE